MRPSSPHRSAQPASRSGRSQGWRAQLEWRTGRACKDVASLVSVWLDIIHVKNKPGFPSDFSVVEEEESLGCRV